MRTGIRRAEARPRSVVAQPPAPRLRRVPAPPLPAPPPPVEPRRLDGSVPGAGRAARMEPPRPRGATAAPRAVQAEPPARDAVDLLASLLGSPRLREVQPQPLLVMAKRPRNPRFEYLELLKRVIREVYRVSTRHPPMIMHVGRRLTEYQLAMMRGGAGIYVVDLDEVAESEAGGAALSRLTSGLEDRLREVYAQPPGVVILYGSEDALRSLRRLWRPRYVATYLYTRIPEPVEVSLPEEDDVLRAVEALYTLPEGSLGDAASVDEAVVKAESLLMECLRGHASDPVLGRMVRQAIDDEESRPDDAPLHYGLKAAAVAHLLESGVRETSIETEVAVSSTPVDVYARRGWSGGLVVEAETLTAAMNPSSRLAAVASSRTALGIGPVWVVLSPLTAGIYVEHVDAALRGYIDGGRVEAYVVDTQSCLLAPYREHRERLLRVARRLWARRRQA